MKRFFRSSSERRDGRRSPLPADPPRPILAALSFLWLVSGAGCQGAGTPPAPPTAASRAADRLVTLRVVPSGGPSVDLRVELAATSARRQRGLRYRRSLPADGGMLFVFPRDGDYPFYMQDTYIPLDLVYLDAKGRVVGVLENLRPLDETRRSVGRPARYVLEVNAHSARRWGLAVGDTVSLPDLH